MIDFQVARLWQKSCFVTRKYFLLTLKMGHGKMNTKWFLGQIWPQGCICRGIRGGNYPSFNLFAAELFQDFNPLHTETSPLKGIGINSASPSWNVAGSARTSHGSLVGTLSSPAEVLWCPFLNDDSFTHYRKGTMWYHPNLRRAA